MPPRKYRRRPARKGRKGRKGFKTNNNLRSLNPIAQRYICKMKYAETVATDANGRFAFNLNSIFDPNRTGVGHQPYGHDTLQTLYNRYRVISTTYRVIVPRNDQVIQAAVIPSNEVLSFTTVAEMKENPRSRYICQQPGGQVIALAGKVYLPSLTGRTKNQYMAEANYQAEFGASPFELMPLNIQVCTGADVPLSNTAVVVELVYTVECFDIKNLAQS
jgi:hypothetical protein